MFPWENSAPVHLPSSGVSGPWPKDVTTNRFLQMTLENFMKHLYLPSRKFCLVGSDMIQLIQKSNDFWLLWIFGSGVSMMHFSDSRASPATHCNQRLSRPMFWCTLLVCGQRNHRYPVTVTVASTPVSAAHRQEDMASQVLMLIQKKLCAGLDVMLMLWIGSCVFFC